ncbi:MAG: hypothetical protein IPG96_18625 [Proteobacteria bacterium]|nr:hypothetical protein [Pseudomonadota bacterium]
MTALGTTVARVATASNYSCVRRTDGSLWCWGLNNYGRLGDGTTMTRLSPTAITAMGTLAATVALGGHQTCATGTDGSLWCWGMNSYGQLGDGTTISRATPTRVTAMGTTVAAVAVGVLHSCARRTDGSMWCWGDNYYGQLGDRTSINRLVPTRVTALGTTVTEIALGGSHSCARRSDGSVWCWGDNSYGALGAPVGASVWQPTALDTCGDGVCGFGEAQSGGCPGDCATTCGDCVCDGVLEDAASCPADCVAGNTCTAGTCGNGKCDATENCQLCATDCGTCYPF